MAGTAPVFVITTESKVDRRRWSLPRQTIEGMMKGSPRLNGCVFEEALVFN